MTKLIINQPWLNGRFPQPTNCGSGRSSPIRDELDKVLCCSSTVPVCLNKADGVLTPLGIVVAQESHFLLTQKRLFSKQSSKGPWRSQKAPIKTSAKKPYTRPRGQFGDIKFSIYVPLWTELLHPYFDEEFVKRSLDETVKFHDKLIANHGIPKGTEKFKEIFLFATQLLEGSHPKQLAWVATGKVDRWPTKLAFLRPLYHFIVDDKAKGDMNYITNLRRFFLTLSKLNRVLEDYSELKVTNLKQTFRISPEVHNSFETFARKKLGKISESISRSDLAVSPFFGPTHGPNGTPKLESAAMEAYHLVNNEPNLWEGFLAFCQETDNRDYINYVISVSDDYKMKSKENSNLRVKDIRLRKLSSVPDSGNKSRTIAICDFWTQSLLVPLERTVIGLTRKVYNDNCAFFSHSEGWRKINEFPHPERLVSLDASDWTDNLPSSLQYTVVKILLGQKIADAWKALAVSCPWYLGKTSQTIKYGKGQGMGTKGSFAIAQLTNLIFIEHCLTKNYPNADSPFFIEVGDDMVIEDPDHKMAREFELIGVPINLSKTKQRTKLGSFVEFVSRNAWEGHDMSLISPTLIVRYRQNSHYCLTLLNHMQERGVNVTLTQLLDWKCDTFRKEGKDSKVVKLLNNNKRLLFLANILNTAFPESQILTPGESACVPILDRDQEIKFLMSLILFPLYKLQEFDSVTFTRDQRIESERLFVLTHNLIQQGYSIWQLAIENKLELPIIRKLGVFHTISDRKQLLATVGYQAHTNGFEIPELFVAGSTLEDGPRINPDALRFMLNLNAALNDVIMDTKFVSNLSLLDKANSKSLLALFSDLNSVCDTSPSLEGDTIKLNFDLDGSKSKAISKVTFQRYGTLLGLQGYLNSLSNESPVGPLLGPFDLNDSIESSVK